MEGYHDDHWVTEYRLPDGRWRLVDAQVLHPAYELSFDPLDVPRDRFLVAGDAWRACREGGADPGTFGVWFHGDLDGLWYIRTNVLLDLAAVNGVELLPWDVWGRVVRDDSRPHGGGPRSCGRGRRGPYRRRLPAGVRGPAARGAGRGHVVHRTQRLPRTPEGQPPEDAVISTSLTTVFQLRLVAITPLFSRGLDRCSASLERPRPFGA